APTVDAWHVEKTKGVYVITGKKIERFAARTDFDSEPGIRRLRDIMKKMGIMHELTRQGAKTGDRLTIAEDQLEY
ncbi:MAG TPA: Obg family GTPase CgtA, partial [Candidatus Saccharimonadales bacterium]|nr:Obg family GTPase CgtA [Candidatus Saccharimonadales bacterium]